MRSKICGSLLTLTLLLFTLPVFAQSEQSSSSPLIGTWQVQVTLRNCDTGDPLGPPPFASILTFARGGTMAEDTTHYAPGQRSAGQGVWKTIGHDVYEARSVAFINFATPPTTTSPGFDAGQQIINQIITYDKSSDTWSAKAWTFFTDTAGNEYRKGCSTATGSRF